MTTKPIQTNCDQGCHKPFTISKFKTQKVKGGNEKTFFRCPHCHNEYVAYYSSQETLQLQKEMRKLHRQAYVNDAGMDMDSFRRQETELKNKIKRSMDAARLVAES